MTFTGKEPILNSPWPLATMGGVALMAKAVVEDRWGRFPTGKDVSLNLRRSRTGSARLRPANGNCPTATRRERRGDPTNPFMPTYMYPTRGGRWIQLLNTYPMAKTGPWRS